MAINITQLRALLAVLEGGGFGAAADSLGISQSAVSHSIAALERALGAKVLLRGGQPQVTEFGARIIDHARGVVHATDTILDLASQRDGLPTGHIRLAAPPTVCQGLLPALMTRWRADFPRVDIALFEGEDDEVVDWLAGNTADLAVLVDPPAGAGVTVGTDDFRALLRDDHPLAGEDVIDVADLEDDPFLLSRGGCERHVRELFRRAKVPFHPAHHVREMNTLLAMVRSGIGVSVIPGLAAAILGPRLVFVPLSQRVSRKLVLSGPSNRPWHPAAAALVAST